MITDADITKLKKAFASTKELKMVEHKLNKRIDRLDDTLGATLVEVLDFIGQTKDEIMKELTTFHGDVNEFRDEMRDINRNSQSTLDNHESRIARLEYMSK
jgi:hypothetical protein